MYIIRQNQVKPKSKLTQRFGNIFRETPESFPITLLFQHCTYFPIYPCFLHPCDRNTSVFLKQGKNYLCKNKRPGSFHAPELLVVDVTISCVGRDTEVITETFSDSEVEKLTRLSLNFDLQKV